MAYPPARGVGGAPRSPRALPAQPTEPPEPESPPHVTPAAPTDETQPAREAPRRHSGHDAAHTRTADALLQRLRSIEGHVRGIQRMVRDDAYCIDVLKQLKAVRAALDKVGHLALETHLETCFADGIRSTDAAEQARVVAEILEVFDAGAKR